MMFDKAEKQFVNEFDDDTPIDNSVYKQALVQ
jgi:hypothetical protein